MTPNLRRALQNKECSRGMDDIDTAVQKVRAARDFGAVGRICRGFASELGFPHFVVVYRDPQPIDRPRQLVLNGYPPTWIEHYDRVGYLLIDPVVRRAGESVTPFFWDSLDSSSPQVARMFAEAAHHGLRDGLSVSVFGPHGSCLFFCLARAERVSRNADARYRLASAALVLAGELHEAVSQMLSRPETATSTANTSDLALTARESQCLGYAAQGMKTTDIAKAMRISERTVYFHMDRVFTKLDVKSRSAAVAKANLLGVIRPKIYPQQIHQSDLVLLV